MKKVRPLTVGRRGQTTDLTIKKCHIKFTLSKCNETALKAVIYNPAHTRPTRYRLPLGTGNLELEEFHAPARKISLSPAMNFKQVAGLRTERIRVLASGKTSSAGQWQQDPRFWGELETLDGDDGVHAVSL